MFLVLDESGSMKPIFSKVTAFVADALVRDYLEPGDYLCVIGFSSEARIRVSQRLSSEAEKENLSELVRTLNVVPQGYTDMGRSLEEALKQLESALRSVAPAGGSDPDGRSEPSPARESVFRSGEARPGKGTSSHF